MSSSASCSASLVHSKSLVPASLLDDRDALRNLVERAVLTDLGETHRAADQALSADGAEPFVASANADWYEPLEDSLRVAHVAAGRAPQPGR